MPMSVISGGPVPVAASVAAAEALAKPDKREREPPVKTVAASDRPAPARAHPKRHDPPGPDHKGRTVDLKA